MGSLGVVYLHLLVCLCGKLAVNDVKGTTCEILLPGFAGPFGTGGEVCFQMVASHDPNWQRIAGEMGVTSV